MLAWSIGHPWREERWSLLIKIWQWNFFCTIVYLLEVCTYWKYVPAENSKLRGFPRWKSLELAPFSVQSNISRTFPSPCICLGQPCIVSQPSFERFESLHSWAEVKSWYLPFARCQRLCHKLFPTRREGIPRLQCAWWGNGRGHCYRSFMRLVASRGREGKNRHFEETFLAFLIWWQLRSSTALKKTTAFVFKTKNRDEREYLKIDSCLCCLLFSISWYRNFRHFWLLLHTGYTCGRKKQMIRQI